MLSVEIGFYLAYRQEVDYKGLNESVTLTIYYRSEMQGASTINPNLSTTLTLTINTLLPLEQEQSTQQSREPNEQYKQITYLN
jgi:hypothetical protein